MEGNRYKQPKLTYVYTFCLSFKKSLLLPIKTFHVPNLRHIYLGKKMKNKEEPFIELLTGFDGANPPHQKDIVMESPQRFRIKTFNEPNSNDHYWFWFNTLVLNHGTETVDVELIVEWPALERFPNHPYDYCFYGDYGNWHPIRATIVGIEARLIVPVKPGKTFVCFYPRYSYGRYERFVASLPTNTPILEKNTEGQSTAGRDIWSFRFTDPHTSETEKPTVLITARGHPYETSGSYIVEAMMQYLLSDHPETKAILNRNIIHFLPITNPDGVVLGLNQQTGLDGINISYGADANVPEANALLGLVERCQPTLWIDIHSWPHQGDDGMWCTHQWIADGLLKEIPDGTWQSYVWNVSFLRDRNTPENHLWQWLVRTLNSGGVSLSFSWYQRTEHNMREIGEGLIQALDRLMQTRRPT